MKDDFCEFCEKNPTDKDLIESEYLIFKSPYQEPEFESYTIVKLTDKIKSVQLFDAKDKTFLFIHEIRSMPGHCYVIGIQSGKNYIGYHTENFVEVDENDL